MRIFSTVHVNVTNLFQSYGVIERESNKSTNSIIGGIVFTIFINNQDVTTRFTVFVFMSWVTSFVVLTNSRAGCSIESVISMR